MGETMSEKTFEQWRNTHRHELRNEFMVTTTPGLAALEARYVEWLRAKYSIDHPVADSASLQRSDT